MCLTVISWNILYPVISVKDSERFDTQGTPTLLEKKAQTGALAFNCYTDATSPSARNDTVKPQERQLVQQQIGGRCFKYYRGGSNASLRLPQVLDYIGHALTPKAEVICLQEVTRKFSNTLEDNFQRTHHVFFSCCPGNSHGVMTLVAKNLQIAQTGELQIQGTNTRLVQFIDVIKEQKIIRVANAHLFGSYNQPNINPNKEAEDLMIRLKGTHKDHWDTIVLCADTNVPKKCRKNQHHLIYAETAGTAGWWLNSQFVGKGLINCTSKLPEMGVCAIMVDRNFKTEALPLFAAVPGISDHDPIGSIIHIETRPQPIAPTKTSKWLLPTLLIIFLGGLFIKFLRRLKICN